MIAKFDKSFRHFADSLQDVLMGYGSTDEDFTARQKRQVETLVKLEQDFRQALIRDCRGVDVYKAFVRMIMDERRNILAARPYFRERQDIFKKEISPILRERADKGLYKFNINYPFIAFAIKARNFVPNSRVMKLANKVQKARKELIEMNLPLAISRASIFRKVTPQAHLEYMDLIQISNEGLIAAVDKFVLPYTPVFRAVIIGRISGNLIEDYSETLMHFYPSDKRKIYKAHKARRRQDELSHEDMAKSVNEGADYAHHTTPAEIQQLVAAASHVSIDTPAPDIRELDGDTQNPVDKYEADPSTRPDVRYEEAEAKSAMHAAIRVELSLFEKKLLILKGIDL